MRSVRIRRLWRNPIAPVVAAESTADKPVHASSLLMSGVEWNAVPTDWDGSAVSGGSEGGRNVPVVPGPFVAAT
ncbi:hypothetical protein AB4Z42_22540 [Mycobacterium sp. 2YAF39]|uniref:hypothetical protein n=1 Tax=Mycobacterium sp. 2YAF39 TaxID=3233033 RepID=UPI003F9AFFA0